MGRAVIEAIDPAKDVDGFHPINVGRLQDGQDVLAPCTPTGVMRLLAAAAIPLRGARAVVLGRSAIVGKPMAAAAARRRRDRDGRAFPHADIAGECRRADILVAAVGRPEMVRGDWIKPGAAVIDVGINRLANGSLVGDCAYAELRSRRRRHHPGAGRGRTHDHRLPAGEHGHGGVAAADLEVGAAALLLPIAEAGRLGPGGSAELFRGGRRRRRLGGIGGRGRGVRHGVEMGRRAGFARARRPAA